jgi:hypothetical protein
MVTVTELKENFIVEGTPPEDSLREELENTQTLEEIKTVVENPSEKNTSGISRPSTSHSEHTFIRTYSVA